MNRPYPSIKSFTLESATQFRVPPPLALTSEQYAADFNETRVLGVATGSTRTEAQTEIALPYGTPTSIRNISRTLGGL